MAMVRVNCPHCKQHRDVSKNGKIYSRALWTWSWLDLRISNTYDFYSRSFS